MLLFDTITLVAYAIVRHAMGLPDDVFGTLADATMLSTGPVAATGSATHGRLSIGRCSSISCTIPSLGVVAIVYVVYDSSQGETGTNVGSK